MSARLEPEPRIWHVLLADSFEDQQPISLDGAAPFAPPAVCDRLSWPADTVICQLLCAAAELVREAKRPTLATAGLRQREAVMTETPLLLIYLGSESVSWLPDA